jgi:hypothetical protein
MTARGRHPEQLRGICNAKERSLAALGMTAGVSLTICEVNL